MTDPAELLARTTAHGPRLDGGRGGIPDLTPADIAGALGMTPAGIGRELLHYLGTHHHGDGIASLPAALDAQIASMIGAEWLRREKAWLDARLALAKQANPTRRVPDEAQYRAQRLTDDLHRARTARWPSVDQRERWRIVRMAIVAEVVGPATCRACDGTGRAMNGATVVDCPECDGKGRRAASEASRARSIGVSVPTYRQTWRGAYSAIYAGLADALDEAKLQFRRSAA